MLQFSEETKFLSGGGEMGELIRNHDWAATALGPPASWPQALKVAIRLMLSTGHPMFIWWGPQLIQFYNDAYRRSLGPERHPSALGQEGRECWQEIWPIIGQQIEQVMAGDGYTWNENQLVPTTRHGSREAVYWTYGYSPIDDPSARNGVGGVLVVCTETTEQVLTQQRLASAEAKWRALFDQAPVFMCTLKGPDHIFEYANTEYLRVIGQQQVVGKAVQDVLPEVVSQKFVDLLDQVYKTGSPYEGRGVAVDLETLPGGPRQRLFVDFIYQPLTDENNKVTGILVAGHDVTENVKSRERLQEQDRRKNEFLAMLAHELRNPLAPIASIAELLIAKSVDEKQLQDCGQMLKRQSDQLTYLVNDLLDVSRITRGVVELKKAPVNISLAIENAIESAQPLISEKHHELKYFPSDNDFFVVGDMQRLVQCFSNVLVNAIKYTPSGGTIEVHVTRSNDQVAIIFADNGIGIAPEKLPGIFELFSQAEPTIDRAQGGLGLGLSIVQRLIQMHSGIFTAASEGLGKGSQFTIKLALIDPPKAQKPELEKPQRHTHRILLVDDNVDAAQSLAQLLSLQGYDTLAVYSARECMECLTSFAPEVALLDIGLPDVNGYELARQLKQRSPSTRLIALTGYGAREDRTLSKQAGFQHHLTKPVALSELEQAIQTTDS